MVGIVRFADAVMDKRQQFEIPVREELGEIAQALMSPPDGGSLGQKVGTERDCFFRHAPGKQGSAKIKRRLARGQRFHVPGDGGTSKKQIPCRSVSEFIGHGCYTPRAIRTALKPVAGRWSSASCRQVAATSATGGMRLFTDNRFPIWYDRRQRDTLRQE